LSLVRLNNNEQILKPVPLARKIKGLFVPAQGKFTYTVPGTILLSGLLLPCWP